MVEELIPNVLTLGGVQRVLRNLLAEGIPITDLGGILEAIADNAPTTKDFDMLTELVRKSISRTICANVESRGSIGAITLDPTVERMIAQSVQEGGDGTAMVLDPLLGTGMGEFSHTWVKAVFIPLVLLIYYLSFITVNRRLDRGWL